MSKLLNQIKTMGLAAAMRLAYIRLSKNVLRVLYIPLWLVFKMRNLSSTYRVGTNKDLRTQKESNLRRILAGMPEGKFLEVGIGEFPHFERLKLINEHSISYTACDLASVCKSHQRELSIKGVPQTNFRFAWNSTGTYAWTMFEMLEKGEQFDVIYIDGHHTFYVDLPAMLLADRLLKPGGYLLLDDITWTLSFLRTHMTQSLSQWYFYRTMYNFSEYTRDQQSLPHIKMIAERLLIEPGGYRKDDALSLPHWWALRKLSQ